ncbi:hypothetical protein ACFL1B_00240 [Nanoarchaeota archaeon]
MSSEARGEIDREPVFVLVLLICLLMASAYLIHTYADIMLTGRATASFDATMTVVDISYVEADYAQLTEAIASGPNVNISIPVVYGGSGIVNVTIYKPRDFTNGFNWYVIEDGVTKNVTVLNGNLQWGANFSATDVDMFFQVLSPYLTIEFTEYEPYNFTRQVRIGSENPFKNVSANVSINASYSGYTLYELDRVEDNVTSLYSLAINDSMASWSNFTLSTKTFKLFGTSETAVYEEEDDDDTTTTTTTTGGGGGGGGGGGAGGSYAFDDAKPYTVEPDWIDIIVKVGERRRLNITVSNLARTKQNFTVNSTMPFIDVATTILRVPAKLSMNAVVYVEVTEPGAKDGRVLISNGMETRYVFIHLDTIEPEQVIIEKPVEIIKERTVEVPGKGILVESGNGFLLLLIFIVFLAIAVYLHLLTMGKKLEEKHQEKHSKHEKKARKRRKPKAHKPSK